jgi:MFS family permease
MLVCGGGLAMFSSFLLLLAVLPLYIKDELGAGDGAVGLVLGVFAFAALVPRPFIGQQIDRGSRKRFLLAGGVIFAASSALYLVATSLPQLLVVRVLHGLGMACFHTAAFTTVADLAPAHRRGEAMGIWGTMSVFATAIGPYLGLVIHDGPGDRAVFLASAGCALAGLAAVALFRERQPEGPVTRAAEERGGLIEPSVFTPSLLILSLTLVYGTISSFIVLYAEEQGISNGGLYFTAFALATLASRVFGGKLSDRFGRRAVILPSLCVAVLTALVLSLASTLTLLLLGGVLFGLAFGAGNPAMTALAIDLVPPARRGSGMGTYTAAFELGIGAGAISMGAVAGVTGYATMFLLCSAYPLLGLAFALTRKNEG